MGVYGYCVVPAGVMPPERLTGLGGAAVEARSIAGLAVWVSQTDRPEPGVEAVKAHNSVIEAAVTEEVTPVPLRFGQWSEDAEIFDRVVTEKAGWYEERLRTFAGAMEFGMRVAAPGKTLQARDVQAPKAQSGLEYMQHLRAQANATQGQREEAEEVRLAIAAVMSGIVREERTEEPRTQHGVLVGSHLVSREYFDEYHQRTSTLRTQFPELRFLVSGPWVPYSFAV